MEGKGDPVFGKGKGIATNLNEPDFRPMPAAIQAMQQRCDRMHITGDQLKAILKQQGESVELRNRHSRRLCDFTPAEALRIVGPGRFIGVGNMRRIRYIRPDVPVPVGHRGRYSTRRIRNDNGVIIAPDFHLEHKPLVFDS